ncbi:MAG TPA: nuclear transport factor 2 family protein [Ferruginibacter sp.]|nr:nuclear transport factor 2 family protein [Ferruginibacter sp.]HMP20558.1 nuclear transport factor 2 family protein [Ferruginibacter sp.]
MKKCTFNLLLIVFFLCAAPAKAQHKDEAAVAAAVEQMRLAMINADSLALTILADEQLSYGHSGGAIDDKKDFVGKIVSGRSDFVSITLTDQTIAIAGKTAIVRHKLDAVTNDNGKPGEVKLSIILVWHKHKSAWKLLARQAVKRQ